jgi:pyruvate formate lyase activating enzyme
LKLADLILPDIKHIDSDKCKDLVGQSNENTLKTLDYLDEIKKPYRLRQVIVPGYTDDEFDLRKL